MWAEFYSGVNAAIQTAWPEITVIYRGAAVERLDWRALLLSGDLATPYVVVVAAPQQWADGPITATIYDVTVSVYYIDAVQSASELGYLDDKMRALQAQLQDGLVTGFQTLDTGWATDVTESNPVNQMLLEQQMPLKAGGLTFHALVGDMP